MKEIPYTIEVLDKLRWNCHLGKHKHFSASRRGRGYHVMVGVPIILINLVLGSVFFAEVSTEVPEWAKWAGAALALIAALLGGVQTFFHFQKEYEGHREVGNQYLALARECERLIALYFDGLLDVDDVSGQIQRINKEYNSINRAAEAFTTSDTDYRVAKKQQDAKSKSEPSLLEKERAKRNGSSNVANNPLQPTAQTRGG